MGNSMFGGCPYQCEDGFNDRNRFPHDHMFVGEIENGKRYPYDTYSKEEEDARFAVKQTEDDLADLVDVVSHKADESECVDIRARLDALEYVGIKINSFSAAPPVCEVGSSQTITLSWSLNKQATSQNINGSAVTGNAKTYTGVTSGQAYVLNVSDGQTSASKTINVTFANRIYYGVAPDLSTVTELSSVLSNDPERTISVNAGSGQYIIYAFPTRLGDVEFYVSGFEGGFEEPEIQVITNSRGYQESYKVYRSTNANLGETTVEVKEV